MRLLSAEARVHLQNLRGGRMSDDDWTRVARRLGEMSGAPLFIDDSPHVTMMEIRAKARRLKQRHGLRLIILDYLQLMSSPQAGGKPAAGGQRNQPVTQTAGQGAGRAGRRAQPAQPVGRSSARASAPCCRDLRESGAIEQDADIVILLHREDVYQPESPRAGEADFIVAKHRNGPTATVVVSFQGHYSRFVDMARTA